MVSSTHIWQKRKSHLIRHRKKQVDTLLCNKKETNSNLLVNVKPNMEYVILLNDFRVQYVLLNLGKNKFKSTTSRWKTAQVMINVIFPTHTESWAVATVNLHSPTLHVSGIHNSHNCQKINYYQGHLARKSFSTTLC